MRRSYKETVSDLKDEALELEEKRSELKAELAKTETRLAQVQESIASLSRLEPGAIARLLGDPPSASSLSSAIRQIFRADPGLLFPTEVRDRLVSAGYDTEQHSNILASVHTCLKRLAETGELDTKEVEGKMAYRLKEFVFDLIAPPKK